MEPKVKITAATGALLAGFACGLWGCGEPSPEPYIELLKSTHSDEREEGAYELLRLGPAAVPRLLEELDSPSSQVRYIVVQLLGRLRDQRAVPFLVAALEDRSAAVAGKAAWSLAELRVPDALPALLEMADHGTTERRRHALRALGFCHSYDWEPVLSAAAFEKVFAALADTAPQARIRVMADRERIVQVLNNLFANAARYSPESSPIRVEAASEGVNVAISVCDEGQGLTAEMLPQLFRKHSAPALGGNDGAPSTGLGLAICKGLVEAHGGRIRAESAGLGQGSRFTFTIPAADDGGADAETHKTRRTPRQSRDKPRILVVDDGREGESASRCSASVRRLRAVRRPPRAEESPREARFEILAALVTNHRRIGNSAIDPVFAGRRTMPPHQKRDLRPVPQHLPNDALVRPLCLFTDGIQAQHVAQALDDCRFSGAAPSDQHVEIRVQADGHAIQEPPLPAEGHQFAVLIRFRVVFPVIEADARAGVEERLPQALHAHLGHLDPTGS